MATWKEAAKEQLAIIRAISDEMDTHRYHDLSGRLAAAHDELLDLVYQIEEDDD